MKAFKWIEHKQEYVDYVLPEGSCLISEDMNEIISCCCCGNKIKYGESFTSRQIHTSSGFGYAECGRCYCDNNP